MTRNRPIWLVAIAALFVVVGASSAYTVGQHEKVIVVRFGQVLRDNDEPGLHFKAALLDDVRRFDARLLTIDLPAQPFETRDKKHLLVDAYLKWRIADVQRYFVATDGGKEAEARRRLEQLTTSRLREEIRARTVAGILATERSRIAELLAASVGREARMYGIEVVDIRLRRIDAPSDMRELALQRMRSEGANAAERLRALGENTAEKIRADAERERDVILATAYRQAEQVRGEGDARATAISAQAYGQSSEFYEFYRSLNAYKESFKKKDDILVVDPSADFFKYLKKPTR